MATAEIIAIGTELLLGEIQDTNTRYLARKLRDAGVDLFRATLVGDNKSRIAEVIREALLRSDIVITSGGLGPTVDDPTREAVALAVGVELDFSSVLWEQIQARFQRFRRLATDNNRRQAYIPHGAMAVENAVGTAPAFICEVAEKCIISLPGVPRELEYLTENKVLPYLRDHYHLSGTIQARVLHCAGVGESQIDDWISDLETWSNPTVGLLAHPGQVDIRVTAKADSQTEAERMIEEMSARVLERVGEAYYGSDDIALVSVVLSQLERRGWHMAALESNLNGELYSALIKGGFPNQNLIILPQVLDGEELHRECEHLRNRTGVDLALGIGLEPGKDVQIARILAQTTRDHREVEYYYGGAPGNAPLWAVHMGLDVLRRFMK